MAVFRVERTRDYTVMSNYHLRDKSLSLKAKGLLSQMLSLPEDWDYTLSGLSFINRESKDAIRSAINELERAGYIIRRQTTDASGKFAGNEYIIHESPATTEPPLEKPLSENPTTDNPSTGKPSSENPTQLNIDISKKEKLNTDRVSTDSLPFLSGQTAARPPEPKRRDLSRSEYAASNRREAAALGESKMTDTDDFENYRDLILENIEFESLCQQFPYDIEALHEIVELMLEVVCAKRKFTRVAGSDFPHEVVKSRLLKLDSEHIGFVLSCMKENTTKVRNIKQYLLTALFNAPTTISNYYSALVNHDMAQGSI